MDPSLEHSEGVAQPLESNLCQPSEVQGIIRKSRHSWLKNPEVDELLSNYREYQLVVSGEAPVQPPGGTLFLFDRKQCRFFRKDGHNWKKKADGKTVKETHEKLKVGNVKKINCYYAHADQDDGLQRRCYWLLDEAQEHIVLVHYLNSSTTRVPGANNGGVAMGRRRPSSGELAGGSGAGTTRRSRRTRAGASAAARQDSDDLEFEGGSESAELLGAGGGGVSASAELLGAGGGGISASAELLGAAPVARAGYALELSNGGLVLDGSGGGAPLEPQLEGSELAGGIPAGQNPWAWFLQQGQQLQLAEQQAAAAAAAAAAEGISICDTAHGVGGGGAVLSPALGGLSEPQRSLFRQISLGLSRLSNLDSNLLTDILQDLEPLLAEPQQAQQLEPVAAAGPATRSRGRVLRQQSSGISMLLQQWLEGGGGGSTPGPTGGGTGADRTLPRLESFGRADSFINQLNQLEGVLSCLPTASQPPNLDIDDLDLPLVDGIMGEGGSAGPSLRPSGSDGAQAGHAAGQAAHQQASPGPPHRTQTDEILRRLFRMVSTARGEPEDGNHKGEHRGEHHGANAGPGAGNGHAGAGGRGHSGPVLPPIFPRQLRQQRLQQQQAAAAQQQHQQQYLQQHQQVQQQQHRGATAAAAAPQHQQQYLQQHRGAAAAAAAPQHQQQHLQQHRGVAAAAAAPQHQQQHQQAQQQHWGPAAAAGLPRGGGPADLGEALAANRLQHARPLSTKRQLDRQESAAQRPAQRVRGTAALHGASQGAGHGAGLGLGYGVGHGPEPPTLRLLRSGSSSGR